MTTETDGLAEQGQDPNEGARPDAEPAPSTPTSYDPDAAELAAARAALEAEERAAAGGESPSAPPTTQDQQPGTGEAKAEEKPAEGDAAALPPPADAGKKQAPPPVPYERFAEVLRAARKAQEEATYLKGAVETLTKQVSAPKAADTPAPPAPPPPEEQIKAKRAEIRSLAERHDSGEITLAEFEEQRGRLDDEIADLRLAQVTARTQAAPAAQAASASLADQMLTNQVHTHIESNHVYAAALTDAQVRALSQIAHAEAAAQGQPYGRGLAEDLRLRLHVAKLSDRYGPAWGLKPTREPPAATNAPAPPPAPKPPAPSPAAQARREKLELQQRLPPDTASLGHGSAAEEISEARVAQMTDDEIAALPAPVRARIMAR